MQRAVHIGDKGKKAIQRDESAKCVKGTLKFFQLHSFRFKYLNSELLDYMYSLQHITPICSLGKMKINR